MNIIKILRKMKGVNQAQLQVFLGATHHEMVMYEKGYKTPDEETLKKLADYFNVTKDSLSLDDLSNRESMFAIILGDDIKDLRLKFGYTQRELAKRVGVCKSTICNWENGIVEPTASAIYQLAKVFDVTSDYLLGLHDFFNELFASPPICDDISNDEQQLLREFRYLDSSGKTLVKYTIKTLLSSSAGSKKNKIS